MARTKSVVTVNVAKFRERGRKFGVPRFVENVIQFPSNDQFGL